MVVLIKEHDTERKYAQRTFREDTRGIPTPIGILQTKEKLNRMLAENCGKDYEIVAADTDRDNWMTAEEAVAYGLIDKVITSR